MTETTTTDADSFELPADSTWIQAVELFQREGAAWLTAADAPQLMALRTIAKQLDAGTFQAALISQFTLIHRALLNRRPGEPAAGRRTPPPRRGPRWGGRGVALGGAWTADA